MSTTTDSNGEYFFADLRPGQVDRDACADVNADQVISPIEALLVINHLNQLAGIGLKSAQGAGKLKDEPDLDAVVDIVGEDIALGVAITH